MEAGAGVRIRLTRRGGARGIEPFDLLPLRLAVGYGLNERIIGYGLNERSVGWREDLSRKRKAGESNARFVNQPKPRRSRWCQQDA
jgi:hypothetical protein